MMLMLFSSMEAVLHKNLAPKTPDQEAHCGSKNAPIVTVARDGGFVQI